MPTTSELSPLQLEVLCEVEQFTSADAIGEVRRWIATENSTDSFYTDIASGLILLVNMYAQKDLLLAGQLKKKVSVTFNQPDWFAVHLAKDHYDRFMRPNRDQAASV